MPQKGKRNFSLRKNKLVNLLRNGLRILFLFIFLHWILWFTTYAKCTNYYEAINDEKIDKHDKKTDKYNGRGLLSGEHKEKDIAEIEEDVLSQIEEKKKEELDDKKLPRKWKEHSDELKQLFEEKKKLEEKKSKSLVEETELKQKKKEYDERFKKAKESTIENIKEQLKKNNLNIAELNDNRNWWQQMTRDPLKFFIVSPLNKTSKALGIHNYLFLEIIFKLVIIEIILLWIYYSETTKVWENMEKIRDPYLSVEEKEKLHGEASSLSHYLFFNGFMMVLFNFFLSLHPAFFDRTSWWFQAGASGTGWYWWIAPIFFSILLSNISTEFLHRGRLLNKQEFKNYLAKSWMSSLVFALVILLAMVIFGMNSVGIYLLSSLGGLVRFIISTVRVKFFGHREYSLQGGGTTMHSKEQYN